METIRGFLARCAYKNRFLYSVLAKLFYRRTGKAHFVIRGSARLKKDIQGKDHSVFVAKGCFLEDAVIRIRGERNSLVFGENCMIGPGCSFWMEGNDISVVIGAGTTFTRNVQVNAQEAGSHIEIGEDCMFSNHIIVRTSDSHPIYDLETGVRLNPPQDVKIGDHVWIAPDVKIMKGACIGSGSVIGSNTMVSGEVPENVLAVGYPATVVKEKIRWSREDLFLRNTCD